MKKFVYGAALTVFMALGLAGNAIADADVDAINRLMNQDLSAGWKQNDPGRVLDIYTEDVPVVWVTVDRKGDVNVTKSKEDRVKELKKYFGKVKIVDYAASNIEVTKVSDNLALVSATEKVTAVNLDNKEENQLTFKNIYEVIKQKDGKWRAYREISIIGDAQN